jgi:hypothetical protein
MLTSQQSSVALKMGAGSLSLARSALESKQSVDSARNIQFHPMSLTWSFVVPRGAMPIQKAGSGGNNFRVSFRRSPTTFSDLSGDVQILFFIGSRALGNEDVDGVSNAQQYQAIGHDNR